jgi:capsular exopolysaccharide synthesis family protein
MGEIADALRRARSQRPVAAPEGSLRSLPSAPAAVSRAASSPAPAPFTAPPAPESKPGLLVGSVEPQNAAIILEQGPHAEACRHLALRLKAAMDQRRARSLAIVSAERGDGKTTVCCDVAIALATLSREREVALIELDLRKPAILKSLSVPHAAGLEEVLLGRRTLDDVRVSIQSPAIDVFPVVAPQDAAHELLVLPQMAAMIADLERRYATVVIDTPPSPLVPDAMLILRHVATCVPVIRAGKTRARSVKRLIDSLPRDRLIGSILNAERASQFGYGDYYHYGEDTQATRPWYLGGESR